MDEISQAQVALGRALDRARAGEDRALAGRVRDEGARLVNLLFGVLGMARLHSLDNRAFDQPIKDLKGALDGLIEILGAIHLLAVEDQVYINDIRIRLEGRGDIAAEFGAHLRQHGAGGISWHGRLTTTQLRKMTELLAASAHAEHPRRALQAAFAAAEIANVEFAGVHRFRMSGEADVVRKRDLVSIEERGASIVEEAWSNLAAGRLPNPLPLRRLVTDVLDVPTDSSDYWQDPIGVGAYAAHTLRIGKLALAIGRALGLSAGALQDLGLAAMFHDVGYATLPSDFDHETALRMHGDAGALLLVRQKGFHEAKVRRVLAAMDHHRSFDDGSRRPSLFGRILAIAEDFDSLVQSRGAGLTPPQALERMMAETGRIYDPVLMQLFANALGRYPPGTILRLEDGRLARVIRCTGKAETFDKPVVRIERQSDGKKTEESVEIDLALPASPLVAGIVAEVSFTEEDALREDVVGRQSVSAGDSVVPPAEETATTSIPEAGAEGLPTQSTIVDRSKSSLLENLNGDLSDAEDVGSSRPLSLGLLPEVLGEIYREKRSGTLGLTKNGERRSVRFWKGIVVRAASNLKSEQLGEVAIREGLLNPEGLDRATQIVMHEKKRLGLVLMELGLVSEEQLGRALTAHVRCVLSEPCKWSDGCYRFEEQQPTASWSEEVAFTLSTPDLILDAVRCVEDPDVIRYLLQDLDRRLRVSRDPLNQGVISKLGPLDGYVLSRVDGRLSVREIVEMTPEDPEAVVRSIFGMLCIGLLEYVDEADEEESSE
jgi:hypothetical protein